MSAESNSAIRRIAHLDMDAFYASVELLRYPQLRGQPVVIGGSRSELAAHRRAQFALVRDYAGRGVVTTASYEAREFGVHSAMGIMQAAQLCPHAILLPADFNEYRKYSRTFKAVVAQFSPSIEDRGIDEVYVDFTQAEDGQAEGGRALALRIQAAIQAQTGLSCSIGVAPNKLLAKMVSEFRKPNGVSVLYESELAPKIWPLACRKINGIGPKASARLEQLGIRTIGELAHCERDWLMHNFGPNHGSWMYESAWGWDDRPVVTDSEPVSMSRETTFERDLHAVRDRAELRALFTQLCEQLAQDLQRHGYVGRVIGVKLRYDNFQRTTRDLTIAGYTCDAAQIRRAAGQCLKRAPLERRLRLLGVRVGGLVRSDSPAARLVDVQPGVLSLF
ncbi:MAG: DNA polymerase IV [Steroidobacteraceae bacterium]|jgi:DNA polymerase IV